MTHLAFQIWKLILHFNFSFSYAHSTLSYWLTKLIIHHRKKNWKQNLSYSSPLKPKTFGISEYSLTFHFAGSLNNHNKFTHADMPQLNFISRLVSKHYQTISTVLHCLFNSKSCNQCLVDLEIFHRWMNWLSLFINLQASKLRLHVLHRAGGSMLYFINNTNN